MDQQQALKYFPYLLVSYETCTYLSNDMYLPALSQIATDFNTSNAMVVYTLTAWCLGTASMQLVLGPLSDRYGRRPVLLIGGWVFVLGTLLCACTHTMHTLILGRFLEGVAVCAMNVAGYGTVHESYEHHEAIRVLALMSSINLMAPAFGPLLGSLILQVASWRVIFWLLAVVATITLAALYRWMPESRPPALRQPFSLKRLLASYRAIVTNKLFMVNSLVFCFLFAGIITWLSAGPLLITETYKHSPMVFGLAQVLLFGAYMLGARSVKYAIAVAAIPQVILFGLSMALCGGFLAVVFADFHPQQLLALVLPLTLFTFGCALIFSPLQRIGIEASLEPMGTRIAIFSSLLSWFSVLGSLAASFFYSGTSFSLGLTILVAILVAFGLRWYAARCAVS